MELTWNFWRRWLQSKLGKQHTDWKNFPLVIHMDTTNRCGPKYCGVLCQYCFSQWYIAQGEDSHTDMPMEWIDWVLKEVARDGKTLDMIAWFFNGDGLMETRMHELVRKSKKYAPWAITQTFTCGTLTENVDLVLDRNMDNVCFTISAHNRELYKRVHRGDRFDNAIETLKTWLDKRPPNQTGEIHMVLTNDNYRYAQEWWDYFGEIIEGYERVRRIISPIVLTKDNVPAQRCTDKLDLDMQDKIVLDVAGPENRMWMRHLTPMLKPCNVWDDLTITAHLRILQCCNWCDYETWNYGYLPDLVEMGLSLRDVWMMKMANKMNNIICATCNQRHPNWRERLNAIEVYAKHKS